MMRAFPMPSICALGHSISSEEGCHNRTDPRQGCGEWFDMRNLGQVLAHVHDADIEIGEGPMPPRENLPQ
jgi:hypothetical protein